MEIKHPATLNGLGGWLKILGSLVQAHHANEITPGALTQPVILPRLVKRVPAYWEQGAIHQRHN